jgi:hypothetical protein
MPVNIALFFRLTFLQIFRARGTNIQFNGQRRKAMLVWYLVIPIHQLLTIISYYLDEIFFGAYRRQEIKAPVFIVGNFRSGSSLLQRLLASDGRKFTSMNVGEIYLAPTITQRKFWSLIRWLDKHLNKARGLRFLETRDQQWLDTLQMHKTGLFTPDEDEGLLILIWATMFLQFVYPLMDELPPFYRFDEDMPERQRKWIMNFYKAMIRRHLYVKGGDRMYLAKSPAHSARIDSLLEYFPDARIIYLARNPLSLVPSVVNFFRYIWRLFGDLVDPDSLNQDVFKQIHYWYRYPVERLKLRSADQYRIYKYADLVNNLEELVEEIYQWLGLRINDKFRAEIFRVVEESKKFQSDNIYTLDELGLSEKLILEEFSDEMSYFGFKPEIETSLIPQ